MDATTTQALHTYAADTRGGAHCHGVELALGDHNGLGALRHGVEAEERPLAASGVQPHVALVVQAADLKAHELA